MTKGIKLLLCVLIMICNSGTHFLFSQEASSPEKANEEIIVRDERSLVNKNKVLISSLESSKTDKSNLLPVRKTFSFNLGSLLRGLLGLIVLVLIAYLLSENKKSISWKTVGLGLLVQVILAILILHVPFIQSFFEFIGKAFVKILDFTNVGTEFLFKSMATGKIEAPLQTFAIKILPTILFFSALTSVLFYFGIIQKIVWFLAWMLTRFLKISGAESLSVAGNIFLGMSETPLMIKAYLEKMSRSEMMLVMSGGMATMAGGVLAVYINFLGGDDPLQKLEFARHLLAASVMAAPGIVVVSKIMIPQTIPINMEMKVDKKKVGNNILDAISKGTGEGLRLAVNVAAMLLVFLAFLAFLNFILCHTGNWIDINTWVEHISDGRYDHLSLQFILGLLLSPLMWILGVGSEDIMLVGSLLGEKLIMTEFVGYISLAEYKAAGLFADPRSIVMATYILCGFANIASVGIQIAAIGALAPGRKVLISGLGFKALVAGALASLFSAVIVGVILG